MARRIRGLAEGFASDAKPGRLSISSSYRTRRRMRAGLHGVTKPASQMRPANWAAHSGPDRLTRVWAGRGATQNTALLRAWLQAEPGASFPAPGTSWRLAHFTLRHDREQQSADCPKDAGRPEGRSCSVAMAGEPCHRAWHRACDFGFRRGVVRVPAWTDSAGTHADGLAFLYLMTLRHRWDDAFEPVDGTRQPPPR
jgi:hypothetical protein